MSIRVLVVDDQALIRDALSQLLKGEDDVEVVGHADNGKQAVFESRRLRPDIVLMDIRMPTLDGIEATRLICADEELAQTRVLILTTFEEDENVVAALRAGASGFLGKGLDPTELALSIRTVHAGDALLSPTATRGLIDRVVNGPQTVSPERHHPGIDQLTDRELEVLTLVAQGLSNDEIGRRLFISASTAKTHVNRTMTKLWAHDRAQLVVLAYENGLVVPGGNSPQP